MSMDQFRHDTFIVELADYVVNRLDESQVQGLAYKGILPPISTRNDFEHFPTSLYPFVGVAPLAIRFQDQSLGQYFPTYQIQVIFSNRDPGIDPTTVMADMLVFTQQLQDILIGTIRSDLFGLSNIINAAELQDFFTFPTFYTQVEGDRKCYSIGYFTINLFLGGL